MAVSESSSSLPAPAPPPPPLLPFPPPSQPQERYWNQIYLPFPSSSSYYPYFSNPYTTGHLQTLNPPPLPSLPSPSTTDPTFSPSFQTLTTSANPTQNTLSPTQNQINITQHQNPLQNPNLHLNTSSLTHNPNPDTRFHPYPHPYSDPLTLNPNNHSFPNPHHHPVTNPNPSSPNFLHSTTTQQCLPPAPQIHFPSLTHNPQTQTLNPFPSSPPTIVTVPPLQPLRVLEPNAPISDLSAAKMEEIGFQSEVRAVEESTTEAEKGNEEEEEEEKAGEEEKEKGKEEEEEEGKQQPTPSSPNSSYVSSVLFPAPPRLPPSPSPLEIRAERRECSKPIRQAESTQRIVQYRLGLPNPIRALDQLGKFKPILSSVTDPPTRAVLFTEPGPPKPGPVWFSFLSSSSLLQSPVFEHHKEIQGLLGLVDGEEDKYFNKRDNNLEVLEPFSFFRLIFDVH